MQFRRHFWVCQRTQNIDWETTWYSPSAERRVDSEVLRGPIITVPLLARSGLGQPVKPWVAGEKRSLV